MAPHATKCIFLGYGTNGEFGYMLWDLENRKLIRSSDVVFNEDSIFFKWNQQKTIGKKVSFQDDRDVVQGPTHRENSNIRQTIELEQADNVPADSKLVGSPIVELEDKAINDRADLTRVQAGKVNKMQVGNRTETTKSLGEDNVTPPKYRFGGGAPNKTPDTDDSTNTNRPT